MRVCNNPQCHLAGQPQPAENFYTTRSKKYRCKVCCRLAGQRNHARLRLKQRTSSWDGDREPHLRLPGDPWREWLEQQLEAFGGVGNGGMEELSNRLDVIPRVITRWLRDSVNVDLDAVDRALCSFGAPWVLRELWPSLFSFDEDLEEVA